MRSDDFIELWKLNPNAFMLAFIIASRARFRPGFSADGLGPGEALLGDHRSYGMTEKQYRVAKQHLQKYGFGAFKSTPKGTIARLTDSRLFETFGISENAEKGGRGADSRTDTEPRTPQNGAGKRADSSDVKTPIATGIFNQPDHLKGEQNAGQRADKGRTNCENRATKKKDKEVKKERTVVSNDDVPAMAGEFDELEAAMRKVVIADANESIRSADQTYAPFYIPTDAELLAFVEDQELSDDAVAVFMFARSTDAWQIRKSDGRVEGVRDWRKFLTAFCEKYERDRENLT